MSASERLRALVPYFRSPILQDNALASQTYIRALPLIADVVEAAEDVENVPSYGDPDFERKLLAALTALREHLDGAVT